MAINYLQTQLSAIEPDGKFHYLNFPAWGEYQLREKTPEEKGELWEGTTLVSIEDFQMFQTGSFQQYTVPLSIQENTVYKIELQLSENFDFSVPETFFVDFYRPDYDDAEQEANGFLVDGQYSYLFYFNSGMFGTDTLDIQARIINSTKEESGTKIKAFKITEMEGIPTSISPRIWSIR